MKPLVPRKVQIFLRRKISKYKRNKYRHVWPIDLSAARPPENWIGWPYNKQFALILAHDVDTQKGFESIPKLLKIEKDLGFKSAFNIVPERYRISQDIIDYIKREGFEVNVHGLKHDGKLFKSRRIFNERAIKINQYLKLWQSTGFTAPSMICNLDWLHDLKIDHSTCTFDTDPFEPQPIPSKTIFPFIVENSSKSNSYVELPYTLPQDHSLFIILKEKDISIWLTKLIWIVKKGGMALLNTHPDYIKFDTNDKSNECYPVDFYIEFLNYIKNNFEGLYWNTFPKDVSLLVKSMNT